MADDHEHYAHHEDVEEAAEKGPVAKALGEPVRAEGVEEQAGLENGDNVGCMPG